MRITLLKNSTVAAAAIAASMIAGGASAATFDLVTSMGSSPGTGSGGNYCGGSDNGFQNGNTNVCNVNGSPWIVKYDFDDETSTWALTEFNTLFGDANNFSGIVIESETDGQWSFKYNAVGNEPGITAFSAKGGGPNEASGGGNNLYVLADGEEPFFGDEKIFFTFPQGNSNVTFFDSRSGDTTIIPLPAAGWLMLAGLGGLAALRRRKKAA